MGSFHLKVDQEGEQGPQQNDGAQHQKLFEVPHQDGLENLGGYFELQAEGQTVWGGRAGEATASTLRTSSSGDTYWKVREVFLRDRSDSRAMISLGLAGGVVDLQHVIIQLLGIGGQLLQHQNGVAHDGGEQIIKLVGDTGGECADGLEPVMVGQLLILAVEGSMAASFLEQGQLPLGALVAPPERRLRPASKALRRSPVRRRW